MQVTPNTKQLTDVATPTSEIEGIYTVKPNGCMNYFNRITLAI